MLGAGRWWLALLAVTGPLASAGRAERLLYEERFEADPGGFYYYPIREASTPCAEAFPKVDRSPQSRASCYVPVSWMPEGFIRSQSPYWVDPNHRRDPGAHHPGAGLLNIVAFHKQDSTLDLREAVLRARVRLHAGHELRGGHLRFMTHTVCQEA